MGCLFRLFLLLLFIGAPIAGVVMALDRAPHVTGTQPVGPAELRQAALIGARIATAPPTASGGKVTLSESEIDLLVRSWASRAPDVSARAAVGRFGIAIGATARLPLPENPLGRYVNIRAAVAPSADGLLVDRLAIGAIEVPRPLIRPLVVFTLNSLGDGQGDTVFDSVRSIAVAGRRVTVGLSPAALGGIAGGALPSTGNVRIDEMIRKASPADRQRVMDEITRRFGADPAARQRALREMEQQYGGQLPSDPGQAMEEIERRLSNDPAARERAKEELRRRQGTP